MKLRIYAIGIISGLSLLYVAGCRHAGSYLVRKDDLLHADAIVMLMGSISDRVLQVVDLYQSGIADTLLIVEGQNDGYKELKLRGAEMISGTRQVCNVAIALGIPADKIIVLEGGAKSTQHEAMIVRDFMSEKPGLDTIILVSSAQHMQRAFMIFKNAFRKSQKEICILCSPSSYTDFNQKKWWKSKDDIEIVLFEYLKLANFLLFEKIGRASCRERV